MKEKYTFELLRNNLKASIWDGVFYSLMVGLGETYFQAFAVAYGFSSLLVGLVSTIPLITGSFIQLATPFLIGYFGSYKKWVIASVSLQGLCFIPLAVVAYRGGIHPLIIFLLITLYWACGMSAGPVWNAWLHSLLPSPIRMGFFAKRNALNYLATFTGIILTGLLLEEGKLLGFTYKTFALIFILSGMFRFFGVYCLNKQSESSEVFRIERTLDLLNENENENGNGNENTNGVKSENKKILKFIERVKSTLRLISKEKYGKILLFVLFFKMSVYFAAPFFTPFMLVEMKLSYWMYMLIISASFIGRITVMRFMRSLSTFFGVYNFLLLASFGIVFIPVAWIIFVPNVLYLFIVEIFSGMLWGVFDLCVFIIVFNDINEKEQAQVLSLFNFIHNLFLVISSFAGGIVLSFGGSSYHSYIYIFMISTFLRLISLRAFPDIVMSTRRLVTGQVPGKF
ncbi:MAG: MFS transporter [Oligoflexia bacterium]|nr:MFS transporter [Oligoflexia bacterium]